MNHGQLRFGGPSHYRRACDRCGAVLSDDCRCAADDIVCPTCNYAHERPCGILGRLGAVEHYRCRRCGQQWYKKAESDSQQPN